jgi:hypothetical protein
MNCLGIELRHLLGEVSGLQHDQKGSFYSNFFVKIPKDQSNPSTTKQVTVTLVRQVRVTFSLAGGGS